MFSTSEDSKTLAAAEEMRHAIYRRRRHDQDLLSPRDLEEVLSLEKGYDDAIRTRDAAAVRALDEKALPLTRRVFPTHPLDWLRENVEVFVVAMVLALAVRTYFAQPFKIPTGSMQPTLFGVTVQARSPGEELPGIVSRTWDSVIKGRTYGRIVAQEDGEVLELIPGYWMIWFEYTDVVIGNGMTSNTYRIWLNHNHVRGEVLRLNPRQAPFINGRHFRKGDEICNYVADTGDQLLVNKFIYHFRKPQRGEIFVFSTALIPGLTTATGDGTQYYIKRCAGVPGDTISIERPYLIVNGKTLRHPYAFERMYSGIEKPDPGNPTPYNGYFNKATFGAPGYVNKIGAHQYWALGDNSDSSKDSRYWGTVPEESVVGTPLFVYWPFSARWGPVQ
ncbi:signal peptidase I [Verrucomicrobia bacterium LW23]|nr:signal peptidase I [Verrucomicrobia bacterium LW23]